MSGLDGRPGLDGKPGSSGPAGQRVTGFMLLFHEDSSISTASHIMLCVGLGPAG